MIDELVGKSAICHTVGPTVARRWRQLSRQYHYLSGCCCTFRFSQTLNQSSALLLNMYVCNWSTSTLHLTEIILLTKCDHSVIKLVWSMAIFSSVYHSYRSLWQQWQVRFQLMYGFPYMWTFTESTWMLTLSSVLALKIYVNEKSSTFETISCFQIILHTKHWNEVANINGIWFFGLSFCTSHEYQNLFHGTLRQISISYFY